MKSPSGVKILLSLQLRGLVGKAGRDDSANQHGQQPFAASCGRVASQVAPHFHVTVQSYTKLQCHVQI